jgi:hypothetical protein
MRFYLFVILHLSFDTKIRIIMRLLMKYTWMEDRRQEKAH